MSVFEETPQEREARMLWLKVGCENGLYHPEGEEIGASIQAHSLRERLYVFQQNLLLSEGEPPLPDESLIGESPSLISEREAQEADARIRAGYGVGVWEWRILGFILGLIGLLILRNLPACADWGWR